MKKTLLAIAFSLMLTGCATRNMTFDESQKNRESWTSTLERGKFKGHIRVEQGGSPFSLGEKTVFFLGPENMSLLADGQVDFSQDSSQPSDEN